MNLQKLLQVILNLLGIYTIFSAIVSSGMSALAIPFLFFVEGGGWEVGGFWILSVVLQFFVPVTVGVVLVWKSDWIAAKVLRYSGIDPDTSNESLKLESFPFVAFSLLGVYMLSQTLPSFSGFVAMLFQQKIGETAAISAADSGFLELYAQDVVYHAVAVGFSLLVFMKGKSFAKLALSLRKE